MPGFVAPRLRSGQAPDAEDAEGENRPTLRPFDSAQGKLRRAKGWATGENGVSYYRGAWQTQKGRGGHGRHVC